MVGVFRYSSFVSFQKEYYFVNTVYRSRCVEMEEAKLMLVRTGDLSRVVSPCASYWEVSVSNLVSPSRQVLG
jgi:hypothetical protein